MTRIRTTCPRCGEVDMGPEAILLSVHEDQGDGSYRFLCPTCMETVEKPADRRIVALLLSAGVDLADGLGPDDGGSQAPFDFETTPPHPEARPSGPVFTPDDLIAFHFMLNDDDWLQRELLSG